MGQIKDEFFYESSQAREGKYAELIVATALAQLSSIHHSRGAHTAVLPMQNVESPGAFDALAALLPWVSTPQIRRRYERVIVISEQAHPLQCIINFVRTSFPHIVAIGRLFSVLIQGDENPIDHAVGCAMVVST